MGKMKNLIVLGYAGSIV